MSDVIFNRFIADGNFRAAFLRVRAKGARGGIDGVTVEEFGRNLDANLGRLRAQIAAGKYIPHPVSAVNIPKFNGKGEWRELGLPVVADKVVQSALHQVVEPLAERRFHDTSYGYRPGKGPQKAICRIEHLLVNGKRQWTVIRDIDKFFDSLDHDRLLRLFSELVEADPRLVELVALWCRNGIVARDGQWRNVEAGVRQGQVISPLLANLYLDALDEHAAQRGWGYVRYADDYILLSTEKDQLDAADKEAREFLDATLHLRLNEPAGPIASLEEGFTYLGVLFKGSERTIAPSKIEKMTRKIGWVLSPRGPADPAHAVKQLREMVEGWRHYYGFLKPEARFTEIDGVIAQSWESLVSARVREGRWPAEPPDDLVLPGLSADNQADAAGRARLAKLWRHAVEGLRSAESVKKSADRKIGRRRRAHRREEVSSGEIVVVSPGHFVARRGERIVVRKQQTVVAEVPGVMLKGLTIGDHGCALSTDVIRFCVERDLFVNFIDGVGRVIAVASRPDGLRAELVALQVRHRDDGVGLHLARMFVWGKVRNQLAVLKGYAKYRGRGQNGFRERFAACRSDLEALTDKVHQSDGEGEPEKARQRLMGLEGSFAAKYWECMAGLLHDGTAFAGRVHKGAQDLVNSLLNYGYAILYSEALNAVARAGLNAMAGFLHSYQPGKPVLTYDLVEEFRAPVVDRAVFSMLNRREPLTQGADHLLTAETRKRVAAAVLSRLAGEAVYRGKQDTFKNILGAQSLAVRDHLLGKSVYRSFLARW